MKFGIRLRVIKWLLESLAYSCIDEYVEFEDVAQYSGSLLWAIHMKEGKYASGIKE